MILRRFKKDLSGGLERFSIRSENPKGERFRKVALQWKLTLFDGRMLWCLRCLFDVILIVLIVIFS